MFDKTDKSELERLDFEKMLWIILIGAGVLNIIGDTYEQEYITTKDREAQKKGHEIFEFTIFVSFVIYIYYFWRNYTFYKNETTAKKRIYLVNLVGSIFLLGAALCFIYFEEEDEFFEGTPSI